MALVQLVAGVQMYRQNILQVKQFVSAQPLPFLKSN
jgi:hypothetical protein